MESQVFYSLLRLVLLTIGSQNGGRSSYINCGIRCVYVTLVRFATWLFSCSHRYVETPTTSFTHIWSCSSSISFLPSTHWHLNACLGALQEPAKRFNKECAKQSCFEAKKAKSQIIEIGFGLSSGKKKSYFNSCSRFYYMKKL